MPDKSNKDEHDKMKTAESWFPLEVTPDKLVVPPNGVLEVKVRNWTEEKQRVYIRFDSFFFLMQVKGQDWVESNEDSISELRVHQTILPGEILVLNIGYLGGKYTRRVQKPNAEGKYETVNEVIDAAPKKRINYSEDKPEGKLHLSIDWEKLNMPLFLQEETKKYIVFREQFWDNHRDQQRRVYEKADAKWKALQVTLDEGVTQMEAAKKAKAEKLKLAQKPKKKTNPCCTLM